MFSDIPSGASIEVRGAKRRAFEDISVEGQESKLLEDPVVMKLFKAFGKAILYHEDALNSMSREANIVIRASSDHPFMQAMEYNHTLYQDTGAAARKEANEKSKKFMGNPLGKKPDVMLKSLLFRFAATMKFEVKDNEVLENAGKVLQAAGQAASQPNCDYVATRCFRVVTKGSNEHKWIFRST